MSHVKSLHSDNNIFQQKLEKSFHSFPEMFNKTLKDNSDQSVKEKTQILCGKLEQFAESELQLKFTDILEPSAYLIEYKWQRRKRMRKLKIGFNLDFR